MIAGHYIGEVSREGAQATSERGRGGGGGVARRRGDSKNVFSGDGRIVSDSLPGLSAGGRGAEANGRRRVRPAKRETEEEVRSKEDGKRGGKRGSSPELSTDGM